MRDFVFIICTLLLIASSLIRISVGCTKVHKKRTTSSSSQRYQPKTRNCHDCELQHKHLLLVGFNMQSDKLRRCSILRQIDDFSSWDINEDPETLIVMFPSHDWHPEPIILDLIVQHLGNVSVFLAGPSLSSGFLRHCRFLGPKCFRLETLLPVIRQIQQRAAVNAKLNITQALLDLYNVKHLPGNMTTPKNKAPTVPKQIDQLFSEVCKRHHKLNLFIEISKTKVEKTIINMPSAVPEASLLLSDILPINQKTYDKNRAPKVSGQPTIVYFHVTVLSLDSINEESMTYVADVFLAQSWRDPRLRLPENMSEEYRILDVEWLHNIWRPDCFFKNAKQVTFHEMSVPNHYLWLYHDKTLLYMSKLTLVLSCAMKFEAYPHDTQICSIMIESLSHTTHDLMFIWNITDPLVVNPDIELPQLDIANNYTTDCTLTYSTGNFTCLGVVFTLRRRLGYHLFHTYIPSALIVVMSWISFWIKPEAIPARITLGVTSLLTLATQNTQSQQSLPPVSYVKAIDVWMSSCSVFVFLSLMEFAVVNNYMGPVATKAMKGFSDEDIRTAMDEFRDQRNIRRPSVHTIPQYRTCYGKETAIYIDKFSRFFFPFSFFVLNVVYWSTFL